MAAIGCDVFVKHDQNSQPIIILRDPRDPKIEFVCLMRYGPRVKINQTEYDLLTSREVPEDFPHAMAVPVDNLVWLTDYLSVVEQRERRLTGTRLVVRCPNGSWIDLH